MVYNSKKIEKKWQKLWESKKVFKVSESSKKKKYYCCEFLPYPSGTGLHMGHAFNYTIGDIFARFQRMQGYNVLHPMGFDALGLPAENAAIKAKSHPKKFTETAITTFIKQQKALGLSYDWSRMLKTCDPEYYKWNQFFFIKFFEKGLVYKKKAPVNWCPKCTTVLANEQVHNGKCWRHKDTSVTIKQLEQWFIKTTAYVDELLKDIQNLDWPERIKTMQEHWIGKSAGSEINFSVNGKPWPVFTTRPDTLFGVTFLVVAAQHPKLQELVSKEQKKEVDVFLKKIHSTSAKDVEDLEKEGVFTGSYAIHPLTNEKIPIFAGNFVIAEYGSGLVMAVPAHDQRDFEFAKKYKIPIKQVIEPITGKPQKNPEHRKSIVALVKNPKTGKLLSINWGEKSGGNLFVGGGLQEGENPIKCAMREIEEETGYCDLEYKEKSGVIHHNYFAHSKKKAREIDAVGLFFILKSDKKKEVKLEKDEIGKFSVEWIAEREAEKKVRDELHKHVFETFIKQKAYAGPGVLTNSGEFDGVSSEKAKEEVTSFLQKKKLGKKATQYKLRDWLVSRQRYWGTPIPMIYCDKCNLVPVPEKDLPVLLPEKVSFGKGNPLTTNKSFVNIKCPKCKSPARRETDTMDTFFDSSWYFLRYLDASNKKLPFEKKKADYWLPVDVYIGGAEHACMHLIYARFFTKALRDLGFVKCDEPFAKLFNQGMLHGEDGHVMAKSRGNVIDPLVTVDKVGADALRLFLVSVASPDKDFSWSNTGLESIAKVVKKLNNFFDVVKIAKSNKRVENKVHKTIKGVSEDITSFRYNFAVMKLRQLIEDLSVESEIGKRDAESVLKLFHPFCPHLTEELWEKIKNKPFISLASWPKCDEKKIDKKLDQEEELVKKTTKDIIRVKGLLNIENPHVSIYSIPSEVPILRQQKENILNFSGAQVIDIYPTNDKNIVDPEKKAKKAKPGRPSLYLE